MAMTRVIPSMFLLLSACFALPAKPLRIAECQPFYFACLNSFAGPALFNLFLFGFFSFELLYHRTISETIAVFTFLFYRALPWIRIIKATRVSCSLIFSFFIEIHPRKLYLYISFIVRRTVLCAQVLFCSIIVK